MIQFTWGFLSLVLAFPEWDPENTGSEYKVGESNSPSSGWLCKQNVYQRKAVYSECKWQPTNKGCQRD